MKVKSYIIHRQIKSQDLNHHGTLFAGRAAEWFVEAGLIAAASLTSPKNVVCVNIHGMVFSKPVRVENILKFESKVVSTGRTRIVVHVKILFSHNDEMVLNGFLTFVHVNEKGLPVPHGITIEPDEPEDIELKRKAENLTLR